MEEEFDIRVSAILKQELMRKGELALIACEGSMGALPPPIVGHTNIDEKLQLPWQRGRKLTTIILGGVTGAKAVVAGALIVEHGL